MAVHLYVDLPLAGRPCISRSVSGSRTVFRQRCQNLVLADGGVGRSITVTSLARVVYLVVSLAYPLCVANRRSLVNKPDLSLKASARTPDEMCNCLDEL